MLITHAIQQFLTYMQFERRASRHSIAAYQTDLIQFAQFADTQFEVNDIEELNTVIVRSWLAQLREAEMEPRSVNRKLSAIRSWVKYLLTENALKKDITSAIENLKQPKLLPRFVPQDSMDTFMASIDGRTEWNDLNAATIVALLYFTGIRRSELMSLQTKHIDFNSQTIKVLGKGNKERIIPIGHHLARLLQHYATEKVKLSTMEVHSNFLVLENGKPLNTSYIQRQVKRELTLITTMQKKNPHLLRHSFATHLLNNGAEINAIKDLLGHASLAATQVYSHNSVEKLKEVFRQAHPKA